MTESNVMPLSYSAGVATHPYLDWPGPIPFAHRGGTSSAPENTLPAFEHAVGLGYHHLETDVHLTADGVLVAFHDTDLRRTCGVDLTIAASTWSELCDLRVDGREPIPLMTDLLDRFPDARFNIDCKSDAAAPALVDLVRSRDLLDRVCIGSFSHARLRKIRSLLGPRLITCLSPQEVASLRLTGRLTGSTPRVAQVPVRAAERGAGRRVAVVTRGFVQRAHRQGIAVHVWTIDDAEEMHRLFDLGVDGIMTDRPETLRDVLVERGGWYGGPVA
jgi:glycerophosphoryl diester phosphodiesterase